MDLVKLTHVEPYRIYCDPYAKFDDPTFDKFQSIKTLTNATYPLSWFSDLNGGEDAKYLVFKFVGGKYLFYHFVISVRGLQPVTKAIFQQSINKGKRGM